MNRNQKIANVVILILTVVILIVAWYVMPSGGFWGGVISIPFTLMMVKAMEKYRDERFTHILNLSMRNGFVFLLLALPWTGALIALNLLIFDVLAAILSLWFLSIAVTYGSGVYYFRK
ncbi:hypothetical protein EU528_11830 [Candidatus Thorarchaeota archaeon]|nr:MAG: hypothetical protein EU528_11830 [Candidatus Thorarchaeota archaeon]